MARRDNSDPTGIGQTLNWAWAWPANRRIMYNRASCDLSGQPFDPRRGLIRWNGKSWEGADVPDYKLDENPASGMGPFIMNPERSEEHTSELQSLMRISYAVFCLKTQTTHRYTNLF